MHLNGGDNEPCNHSMTMAEYHSILASGKESGPGSDEITYSMIKKVHLTLQPLIVMRFNKILIPRGEFPSTWKIAII